MGGAVGPLVVALVVAGVGVLINKLSSHHGNGLQALDPVVDNAQTQYEFVRVRGGFKASRQTDASKARVEVG